MNNILIMEGFLNSSVIKDQLKNKESELRRSRLLVKNSY